MAIDRWIRVRGLRVRSLLDRGRLDHELDEELQVHVDRAIAEHMRRGLSPGAARAAALRTLGRMEPRKEEMRDARPVAMAEHLLRDIRLGARQLRTHPASRSRRCCRWRWASAPTARSFRCSRRSASVRCRSTPHMNSSRYA